jgi:hypothetical protein
MNISKFRGDLSTPHSSMRWLGAVFALALAGCTSPYSFAPTPANATATIQPQSEPATPVGFYINNYAHASVRFSSTVSCGINPLDTKSGTLRSQQSLWNGGFWTGCLLGVNPGYVTIHVGTQPQQCNFVIQENSSGWFNSVGSSCQVMFLPSGPFKRGREGGQMFYNLIYGGPGTQTNVTAPMQRALKPHSGKLDGPNILVENQSSSTIHYATTVDGNCQPWNPANGTVDAGGYQMMRGQLRYECGARISFGPGAAAAGGGPQTCILHWVGDLFLLQQGDSTDCDFSEDADGITFHYRL